MNHPDNFDEMFRGAVSAIDAGDVTALERLLAASPQLVRDRLESAGAWLRDKVGEAVKPGGFFERPYLLWFLAEDPVRNGKLPRNIAEISRDYSGRPTRACRESAGATRLCAAACGLVVDREAVRRAT